MPRIFARRVSASDEASFISLLSEFTREGFSAAQALKAASCVPGLCAAHRRMAACAAETVFGGGTLARAFQNAGMSSISCAIAGTAQESGNLKNALGFLARCLERRNRAAQKLASAAIYPAFLAIVMAAALAVASAAVFGQPVLAGVSAQKPSVLTWMIMTAGKCLRDWRFFAACACAAAAFWGLAPCALTAAVQRTALRLPVVGTIIILRENLVFYAVALMHLKAGQTLSEAVAAAASSSANPAVKEGFAEISSGVARGEEFSSLLNRCKYIDKLACVCLSAAAGHGGGYKRAFSKAASICERRMETTVTRLIDTAGPLMILLMSCACGLIVYGIMKPVMELRI